MDPGGAGPPVQPDWIAGTTVLNAQIVTRILTKHN